VDPVDAVDEPELNGSGDPGAACFAIEKIVVAVSLGDERASRIVDVLAEGGTCVIVVGYLTVDGVG